jgi:FtsH-binding integral membrane protein
MEYSSTPRIAAEAEELTFVQRVFVWMTIGLTVTGAIAAVIGTSVSDTYWNDHMGLMFGLIILELAVVFGLIFLINRISATVATAAFFLYSALNGVTLSVIFAVYSIPSIAATFFVTAGMFGAMAAIGWVTKRDLSALGSILLMALIGLILASIVNIFIASDALYWIVTYAGVVIFAGLTAYDMQKIKKMQAAGADAYSEQGRKAAVMGALALYLDFINLFLFLLRIFGRR